MVWIAAGDPQCLFSLLWIVWTYKYVKFIFNNGEMYKVFEWVKTGYHGLQLQIKCRVKPTPRALYNVKIEFKKQIKSHTHRVSQEIYLWRKVVCFVVMRSTKLGCFRSCSWCLWKALNKKGCMGLVPWHLHFWCKSSWILNDFFAEN